MSGGEVAVMPVGPRPLGCVLTAIAGTLRELAGQSETLQVALSHSLSAVNPTAIDFVALQSIDRLTQHLDSLCTFLVMLVPMVPEDCLVEAAAAANRLPLLGLARCLSGTTPDSTTEAAPNCEFF